MLPAVPRASRPRVRQWDAAGTATGTLQLHWLKSIQRLRIMFAMKFSRNQIAGSLILLSAILAFTLARFYLRR